MNIQWMTPVLTPEELKEYEEKIRERQKNYFEFEVEKLIDQNAAVYRQNLINFWQKEVIKMNKALWTNSDKLTDLYEILDQLNELGRIFFSKVHNGKDLGTDSSMDLKSPSNHLQSES